MPLQRHTTLNGKPVRWAADEQKLNHDLGRRESVGTRHAVPSGQPTIEHAETIRQCLPAAA